MCGHDLRVQPKRRQRVSWIDAALVVAVLLVLLLWWRLGSQQAPGASGDETAGVILPTDVPLLGPTPTPTLPPELTPTPEPITPEQVFDSHEVRQGETLLAIAGQYGVTVEQIQQANGLTNELIRVGDQLIIPVLRTAASPDRPPVVTQFSYTVQGGDTVITIAARFGSTVEDILEANNLSENDLIRPDDVLTIPVREVPDEVLESSQVSEEEVVDSSGPLPEGPDTIYIEPRLVGPPNRASISRDEAVLLRWVSVDVLDDSEWYVLLIYPVDGAAQTLPSIWTKATSYRLGDGFAPSEGESATYAWQVSVVRVKTDPNGQRFLEAASPPSAVRSFVWE